LLEVATLVTRERGRVISIGVSMARRSNVESRIGAVLDPSRPLSRRLTRAHLGLIAFTGALLTTFAAALGPRAEPAAAPAFADSPTQSTTGRQTVPPGIPAPPPSPTGTAVNAKTNGSSPASSSDSQTSQRSAGGSPK